MEYISENMPHEVDPTEVQIVERINKYMNPRIDQEDSSHAAYLKLSSDQALNKIE